MMKVFVPAVNRESYNWSNNVEETKWCLCDIHLCFHFKISVCSTELDASYTKCWTTTDLNDWQICLDKIRVVPLRITSILLVNFIIKSNTRFCRFIQCLHFYLVVWLIRPRFIIPVSPFLVRLSWIYKLICSTFYANPHIVSYISYLTFTGKPCDICDHTTHHTVLYCVIWCFFGVNHVTWFTERWIVGIAYMWPTLNLDTLYKDLWEVSPPHSCDWCFELT